MFAKLSTLAFIVPLVAAIQLNSPTTTVVSGGQMQITWTATTDDPAYFSIELVNPAFNNEYAIANNVQTSLGQITISLPSVPGITGYSLQAIATNNVNTVYSTTGTFPISVTSGSSTLPASTYTGTITSFTGTDTATSATTSATTPVTSLSASSAISSKASSAAASSGTSSGASSSPSALSSGAASFKMDGILPAAALVLSAVAGAALIF